MDDISAWRNIESVIAQHDRFCRGVVLLGHSQSAETLIAAFEATVRTPIVKGFAVGRTIFNDAARAWLAGRIDDAAAIRMLAENLSALVEGWRAAQANVGRAA